MRLHHYRASRVPRARYAAITDARIEGQKEWNVHHATSKEGFFSLVGNGADLVVLLLHILRSEVRSIGFLVLGGHRDCLVVLVGLA